ncbi:putative ABC transport system permease protein [Pseudoxanthomonas sp. GM95]|uniref:ABC transporter permease n=1 Tax=Pseudoxanthomonas sp. GM95 TaxID=1881043 RepID=UPI0008C6D600|nr:FtsX-like permease family protein [Pseudoxanthomonas sp. GM95]SEL45225.1 putative ABC transport system permease protein [Pseudoxanthomonas sp. GM95]
MELRPILSTLRRHKIATALIVLEIAFSCAVVCNALFLIGQRLERMQRPTGLDETHLVEVSVSGIAQDSDPLAVTRDDLAGLRAIPGVTSASIINQTVFGSSFGVTSINLQPDQAKPTATETVYLGGGQILQTLGLKVVSGRDFNGDEYRDYRSNPASEAGSNTPVILSQALAQQLFPGQNAVGKTLYIDGTNPVVGVVDRLVQPRDNGRSAQYVYAVLLPTNVPYTRGTYLLRVADPGQRAAVLTAALDTLSKRGPTRLVSREEARTAEQARQTYYNNDRTMAWLLVSVCLVLLLVTAGGIVGLTSFWVQQRTRQIGVRRALGATRGQILRYFQAENLLLVSAGIVLGMLLAFGINQLLMSKYELPRLPLMYLPVGAVLLWLLGQIAVFWPARKAAAVPPAIATRAA